MPGLFDYDSHLMFNPEGHIKQLEFISRTTQLGNTCVALCNGEAGVFIVHVPRVSPLAEPQDKVFKISDTSLFAFSGITNDGLGIVEYLKASTLQEEMQMDRQVHYLDVFRDLNVDAAYKSFSGGSRLYGVAGQFMIDSDGIKLVEWDPTGLALEAIGSAIGHRCQSCRTVLEDSYDQIVSSSLEQLIRLGIRALSNAHPDPSEGTLKAEDVYIYTMERGRGHGTVSARDYMY